MLKFTRNQSHSYTCRHPVRLLVVQTGIVAPGVGDMKTYRRLEAKEANLDSSSVVTVNLPLDNNFSLAAFHATGPRYFLSSSRSGTATCGEFKPPWVIEQCTPLLTM